MSDDATGKTTGKTTIECQDCRRTFVFTAAEARFFSAKGFRDRPRRCAACRVARKKERIERARPQPYVAPHAADVDGRFYAPRPRPQFDANCFVCGDMTRVHFAPSTGRPAFCAACYEARQRQGSGLVTERATP